MVAKRLLCQSEAVFVSHRNRKKGELQGEMAIAPERKRRLTGSLSWVITSVFGRVPRKAFWSLVPKELTFVFFSSGWSSDSPLQLFSNHMQCRA